MSTILVTGGAGYIGSHTLIELLANGHQVVVVDNLINASQESLARVESITGSVVPFYQADVPSIQSMPSFTLLGSRLWVNQSNAHSTTTAQTLAQPCSYLQLWSTTVFIS